MKLRATLPDNIPVCRSVSFQLIWYGWMDGWIAVYQGLYLTCNVQFLNIKQPIYPETNTLHSPNIYVKLSNGGSAIGINGPRFSDTKSIYSLSKS